MDVAASINKKRNEVKGELERYDKENNTCSDMMWGRKS